MNKENNTRIHVHTQSDKATMGYVRFMWETMLMLANKPGLLKLTVHSMSQTAADRVVDGLQRATTILVASPDGQPLAGSYGHGVCVEHALNQTDDGDIHIICDSDTVVLAKGWDDYVRDRLETMGCIGVTYENEGGFSSGKSNFQTYKQIPNVVWMAMSKNYKWKQLRALPKKEVPIDIQTSEQSKIYNLPIGHKVLRDVAWQIPSYLYENKISYEGWYQLKPSMNASECKVLSGLSDYHEEYHVENGIPFVVHHRGSLRHKYREDKVSKLFYQHVDNWLNKEMAGMPHWGDYDQSQKLKPIETTKTPTVPKHIDGEEWVKITLGSRVIFTRKKPNRPALVVNYDDPAQGTTCNLRFEGYLHAPLRIELPLSRKESYIMTLRNASNQELTISTGAQQIVTVDATATKLLLIDVDGVHMITP